MSAHDNLDASQCGDFICSTGGDRRARIYDLYLNGSEPIFGAGISGDALNWPNTASLGVLYDGVPNQRFGSTSWTFRMWAKVSIPGTGFHYIGGLNGPNGYARLFAHYASDAPGSANYVIRAYIGDGGGYLELLHPVEISQADFHRLRMWFDKQTLEVGFQVDMEDPIIDTVTSAFSTGGTWGFQLGEGSGPSSLNDYYDEIGVWHDYLWSDDENEADFNGGDGTGWPDILGSVLRRPMLYWTMDEADAITTNWELVPTGIPARAAIRERSN
jgi:hypothetical protein